MNIITAKDWDLVLAIAHWSYTNDLTPTIKDEAYVQAWKYTDAYGERGYIPAQGYDWSGFRDSSKESTAASANAIRVCLAKHGITEFNVSKG